MQRLTTPPRIGWESDVEKWGLLFHSQDGKPYWFESAHYEFTEAEIDVLEEATNELHGMCLQAVERVVSEKLFSRLGLSSIAAEVIESSWRRQDPSLYGRFDLAFDGTKPPKLLEYNADTPTALLEAAVIQWHWLEAVAPDADQFNSIWEGLVERWKELQLQGRVHFSASDSLEDEMTVTMLMDTAQEAGIQTEFLAMEGICWNHFDKTFVDAANQPIQTIFKLYPWEAMFSEAFGPNLAIDSGPTRWIEPAWKAILSSKGILAILWEMFPNHPLLLESLVGTSGSMTSYVKKPLFGREGANVQITQGYVLEQTDGDYGKEGFVYQRYQPLPVFDGAHALVGSWVIGSEARGIGIRESDGLITTNTSRFVPHLFR